MSRRSRASRPDPESMHANLEALGRFWCRSPFHDDSIIEVSALNRRVVIRLTDLTLVVTGATSLKRCELPAVWLRQTVALTGAGFTLDVETDTGPLQVAGTDLRLIRNDDLAVLIPPIDA